METFINNCKHKLPNGNNVNHPEALLRRAK